MKIMTELSKLQYYPLGKKAIHQNQIKDFKCILPCFGVLFFIVVASFFVALHNQAFVSLHYLCI